MKIILGSQSAERAEILKAAGYDFEVMPADIDERAIRNDDPKELTLALARAKRDALLPEIREPVILITSDLIILSDGKVREKPANEAEARLFLETVSLYPQESVSAVVVTNTANGKSGEGVDMAQAILKKIPKEVIDEYIASGDCYLHAGGFTISHPLIQPYIEKCIGSPDTIRGMPVELIEKLISEVERDGV